MNKKIYNKLYSGNKICWTIIKYFLYLLLISSLLNNQLKFDTIYNIFISSTAVILTSGFFIVVIRTLIPKYLKFSEIIYSGISSNSINISDVSRLKRKLYFVSIFNLIFSFIILGIIPLIYNLLSIHALNKLKLKENNYTIVKSNIPSKHPYISVSKDIKIKFKQLLILVKFSLVLSIILVLIKRTEIFGIKNAANSSTKDDQYICEPRKVYNALGNPIISTTATIVNENKDTLLLRVLSNDSKYYIIIGCNYKPQIDTLISLKFQIGENDIFLNIDSFRVEKIGGKIFLLTSCAFPELTDEELRVKINSITIISNGNKIFYSSNLNSISLFQLLKCVKDEVQKQNTAITAESSKSEVEINSESASTTNTEFYIVRHSALKSEESAKKLVYELRSKYINVDYLWIPNYRTLGTNQFYLVYFGPFHSAFDCSNFIENHGDSLTKDNYGQLVSNGSTGTIIRRGRIVRQFSISE